MKCFKKPHSTKLFTEFKKITLFSLPFTIILVVYIVKDPFMVLYKYTDYNQNYHIAKNVDYIATEKYINNSRNIDYDSFIFGGSTAMYISPITWGKFIDENKEIFAFFASAEHIYGIWSKMKFINSKGDRIKNAIVVLDTEHSFGEFINDRPPSMKHYMVYPSSKLNFQYYNFLQFANIRYLRALLHYEFTKEFKPYMGGYLNTNYSYFDDLTNEFYNVEINEEIKTDSLGYYAKRQDRFDCQPRIGQEKSAQINLDYQQKLTEIKEIFLKNNTEYRIIISPAYNQTRINQADLDVLYHIFGRNRVFNFSGSNEITTDKSNFYDEFHFKKYVGDDILKTIYNEDLE